MPNFNTGNLLESLRSCFISQHAVPDSRLVPSLLTNNYVENKKILTSLTEELETCDAFDFSVAFITDDGVASIMQTLEYLNIHNIPGRILTTNYLNFTSPGALSKILEFPNIELRAYTKSGFHPKGYIFKQSNYYSMIIGSANLTQTALSNNQEWSVKFLSCVDGQIVYTVREEFDRVWNDAEKVNADWIIKYTIDWKDKRIKLQKINKQLRNELDPDYQMDKSSDSNLSSTDDELEIVPNKMQQEAMKALDELRSNNNMGVPA